MAKELKDVEEGDSVWVSEKYGRTLRTVKKLTAAQIILDGLPEHSRFERGKMSGNTGPFYRQIGDKEVRIVGVATEAEAERWEAEQRQLAEERAARRQVLVAREATRRKLTALFASDRAIVHESEHGASEWQVTIHGSEDDMRRIAEAVRGVLDGPPNT